MNSQTPKTTECLVLPSILILRCIFYEVHFYPKFSMLPHSDDDDVLSSSATFSRVPREFRFNNRKLLLYNSHLTICMRKYNNCTTARLCLIQIHLTKEHNKLSCTRTTPRNLPRLTASMTIHQCRPFLVIVRETTPLDLKKPERMSLINQTDGNRPVASNHCHSRWQQQNLWCLG